MSESDRVGKVGAIEIGVGESNEPTQTEILNVTAPIEVEYQNDVTAANHIVQHNKTDYIGARINAYRQGSIDIDDTLELVMEYVLATASKNVEVTQKYESILTGIFEKREAIKREFPKD